MNTAIDLDERRSQVDDIMTQLMKDPEVLQVVLRKMAQMGLEDRFLKSTER